LSLVAVAVLEVAVALVDCLQEFTLLLLVLQLLSQLEVVVVMGQ
jgi:hypothetical protein